MKRVLAALIPILATTQLILAEEAIRERIEWADIWVTDADNDHLPRVLLTGDSITRGYFPEVEKALAGKAYCARLTTSKCVSDPLFPDEVQLLLKQYRFAVIHFNSGLHGWGYTEEQYQDGLLRLIETFRQHAPEAKLVWATTTPVWEASNLSKVSDRTERVRERNRIAANIMQERGIPTNDLFELVEGHADYCSSDGVHFNGKGKEIQAAVKGAAKELKESLRLLKTDHFDLYQLHALTEVEEVEEAFGPGGAIDTFLKAQKDGKIRYIGFSAHSEEAALAAMDQFDFDSVLFPLNFPAWIKGKFGPSVYKRAKEVGMGILALKAMAHQSWPTDIKESERQWNKAWYEPFDEMDRAAVGLRFTLTLPVTALIPPGHWELFKMALDLAQAGALVPMNENEQKTIRKIARKSNPLFPLQE